MPPLCWLHVNQQHASCLQVRRSLLISRQRQSQVKQRRQCKCWTSTLVQQLAWNSYLSCFPETHMQMQRSLRGLHLLRSVSDALMPQSPDALRSAWCPDALSPDSQITAARALSFACRLRVACCLLTAFYSVAGAASCLLSHCLTHLPKYSAGAAFRLLC